MAYKNKVVFTETNKYGCGEADDVYTVREFKDCVDLGYFTDYDGFGYPVKNKLSDSNITISPSRYKDIPKDATHIIWFNR